MIRSLEAQAGDDTQAVRRVVKPRTFTGRNWSPWRVGDPDLGVGTL